MTIFTVYQHPQSQHLESVKRGYCFPIFFLNLIIPLGWVWAFAHRAASFGWRLLALSIIALGLAVFVSAEVVWVFWIVFSAGLGSLANKQIEHSLRRRGFVVFRDGVTAGNGDSAIERATVTAPAANATA